MSDDDQKPHNSGCCKSESEKTIELSLFSSSGRFWTRRRRLVDDHVHQTLWFLDGNWIPRYYTFFCNFLKNVFGEMNLSKCICPNIFVQMYFSKCICKMYLSNCICQNVFFSCLSISLIKCLKGQKCLGLLFNVKNQKWLSQWVSDQWVSDQWQGHLLSCLWTAKNQWKS